MQIAIERRRGHRHRRPSASFPSDAGPRGSVSVRPDGRRHAGHDDGCSGSGIVEGSERYGTWYELNVAGDSDELAEGNWAGQPGHPDLVSADRAIRHARRARGDRRGRRPAQAAASHANVTTVAQAWAAIGSGYPVLICSNIAFEGNAERRRDDRATGHDWPHCMVITSRRTSPKYGRLYLVHQSWELDWTAGPITSTSRPGSFWITEKDLAQILVCQWDRRTVVRDCWTSHGASGLRRARRINLPRLGQEHAA